MKIFTDFHHPALYYSFHLLFEKRLGHTLYRPIGKDWNESGYWKLLDLCVNDYQREEKLAELLIPNAILPYANTSWNKVLKEENDYIVIDKSESIPVNQRGVTLEQFKNMKFDLIIASFINNIEPFKELALNYQDSAKVIVHVGNEWDLKQFENENVLASVKKQDHNAKNMVFYRQEFDIDTFRAFDQNYENQITSFVHPAYFSADDRTIINKIEEKLRNRYTIKFYGKHSRDGYVSDVADIMRKSKFGLHLKSAEDGYGTVIHNWFAVGRPTIFRGGQYKDRLAGELLEHLETGIDVDVIGVDKCIELIKNMSDEGYYVMCNNVKKRFKEIVDFDYDAEEIKTFLEEL